MTLMISCSQGGIGPAGPERGLATGGSPALFLRQYQPQEMVPPGVFFEPLLINDLNQAVGRIQNNGIGLWQDGVVTPLDVPGSVMGLNNNGVLLTTTHVYDTSNGTLTELPGLRAADINDSGQVVGILHDASGMGHLVVWEAGVLTDLGVQPPIDNFGAMNNVGQIVFTVGTPGGWSQPYIWENGAVTEVTLDFPVSNIVHVETVDINDLGQVVGWATNSGTFETGFIWENGLTRLTGGLTDGGIFFTHVLGSNDRGDLVGSSWDPLGAAGEAGIVYPFLWQKNQMFALETLDGRHGEAVDINNKGLIVGRSLSDGRPTLWAPGGQVHPTPPRGRSTSPPGGPPE